MDVSEKNGYKINIFISLLVYSIGILLIILFVDIWVLRIFALPFFFFLLGYPLSFFFTNINRWERFFLSFGLSTLVLLLIYYFQYFSNYYIGVLPTFNQFTIEVIVSSWIFIGLLYLKRRQLFHEHQFYIQTVIGKLKDFIINNKFIIGIVLIATILRFVFLDAPDLTSDETFFVGVSFPVIDNSGIIGLPSPPWQYLSGHHPPIFFVQEMVTMNLLNTNGWLYIYDWMAKFLPAFIGTVTVVVYYGIVRSIFNKWAGYVSAIFIATTTYAVLISRLAYQEALLILILGISIYFAYKERWAISGLFIGLGVLTKFSALTIIPPIIIYLLVRYFRFDIEKFKNCLKNLSSFAFVVLILYLPIIIANIATYIEFGYADSFWSRLLGLPDPMVEAVGEAEIPIGGEPGLLQYFPLHFMQLVNVFGIVGIGFLIFCIIIAFFDKEEHRLFNLVLIIFIIEYLLVFTYRWYQIITLSPLLIPFAIIASRVIKIIPNNSNNLPKLGKSKRKIIVYGIVVLVVGFSSFYSWNTIAVDYSLRNFGDDYHETMNPAYYFSNLGYLWISRYGYDQVMEVVRAYSTYSVYVDDEHPSFSYIYYFYARGMNLLLSDWSSENNSLFVIYKDANVIWEPFESPSTNLTAILEYISDNFIQVFENQNFEIYISN